jgi:hypothetical protein
MDPFAVSWTCYRQLLKHEIPGNPNNVLVEEIDAAIIIFTSTKKSAKDASILYYTNPPQDSAIRDLSDLLRRKRQAMKHMHNLNRAPDRRHYNRRLKHSRIQRFVKDTEHTNITNNIWKITQGFTKHQTQHHTPVIRGRRGLVTRLHTAGQSHSNCRSIRGPDSVRN